MAHNRIKKQRENVTLFNVYFTNSKGRYLFKKPLIFNKKQIYFKMVEYRVERDYSACFKMADWELASFLLLHQILEMKEN